MNCTPKIGHIFGYSSITGELTFLLQFCIHKISNTYTIKIYRLLLKIITNYIN